MSGSNTMCVATVLLETGTLPMTEPVTHLTLESPAGLIRAECECADGKVRRVTLVNQPAFVYHHCADLHVEGLGRVTVDIAYGGMTFRSRNATVVSPGRIDRSPCGTGTSARLAVLHASGVLKPGQLFWHESLIGSRFDAHIESTTTVGPYDAVVPSISGRAWITSFNQLVLDPTDPFQHGFVVGRPWEPEV